MAMVMMMVMMMANDIDDGIDGNGYSSDDNNNDDDGTWLKHQWRFCYYITQFLQRYITEPLLTTTT